MALPKAAIKEDQRLERVAESASADLMRHRWHWTLDESNPERVSMREYARQVGKHFTTITQYANGYVLLQDEGQGSFTPREAVERSKMGAETEAAVEAVAEARDLSFVHTRQSRGTEVRRIREIARERAEQRGTTVEEEAPKAAEFMVKAEKATTNRRQERQQRVGFRYIAVEGKLDKTKRILTDVLNETHDVDWGNEERELLTAALANVKALLNLIDLAIVGDTDVDWDQELAKLTD